MFDNKVTFNISSNTFEILKSKRGAIFKSVLTVVIIIIFLLFNFNSPTEIKTPWFFNILLLIVIPLNTLYIVSIIIFKFNNVKFEKINHLVFLDGKEISSINNLKIINYDIKGGKKSSLYLRINGKEKNIVFSSNPDEVKEMAIRLSEFLNVKLETNYGTFPIW